MKSPDSDVAQFAPFEHQGCPVLPIRKASELLHFRSFPDP